MNTKDNENKRGLDTSNNDSENTHTAFVVSPDGTVEQTDTTPSMQNSDISDIAESNSTQTLEENENTFQQTNAQTASLPMNKESNELSVMPDASLSVLEKHSPAVMPDSSLAIKDHAPLMTKESGDSTRQQENPLVTQDDTQSTTPQETKTDGSADTSPATDGKTNEDEISQSAQNEEVHSLAHASNNPSDNTCVTDEASVQKATESTTATSERADTAQSVSGSQRKTESAKKSVSFFTTHPLLTIPDLQPPSLSSRLFHVLALLPIVPLTLMLIAQTIFSLDARELWYSDEIRHADAFRNFLQGHWFVLEMNGQPYPDKPPLYFLFLRGVYEILHTDGPRLFFAGAALSALFFLWSSLALGKLVARIDGKTQLAAGIILLCSLYMVGIVHYARMDLLFSACIVASHIAFYHACIRQKAALFMLLGFFFAATACLIKGPLGIALPLASCLMFTIWRGTYFRLLKPDFFLGLLFGLLVIGAWATGVYMETGSPDFLVNAIAKRQILERAIDTFHHEQPWHYYFVRLPFAFLPWILVCFFLSWNSLTQKTFWQKVKMSRTAEGEGIAYLWCMALSALALLSALSGKIHIYYLPAYPAVTILLARAIMQFSQRQAKLFKHTMALFFLLVGLGLTVASLVVFNFIPLPEIKNLPQWQLPLNTYFFFVAVLFIITAFALWLLLPKSRVEGVLLLIAICITGISYPLSAKVAPSFDAVLSPKKQAEVLKEYIGKGYEAFTFGDYGGTYSYYSGHVIPDIPSLQVIRELLGENKKIIIAVKRSRWDEWNKTEPITELHIVNTQWIETKEVLLVATGEAENTPSSDATQQPTPSTRDSDPRTLDRNEQAFHQNATHQQTVNATTLVPQQQRGLTEQTNSNRSDQTSLQTIETNSTIKSVPDVTIPGSSNNAPHEPTMPQLQNEQQSNSQNVVETNSTR